MSTSDIFIEILKVPVEMIEVKELTLFYDTDEKFLQTLNSIGSISSVDIYYVFSNKEDKHPFWISINKKFDYYIITAAIPSNYEGVISIPGVINFNLLLDLFESFESSIIFSSVEIMLIEKWPLDQLLDTFLQTTSPNRNLFNHVDSIVTDIRQVLPQFRYLMTWMKLVCLGIDQDQENWFLFLMKGLYDPRLLSLIIYFCGE